MTQAQAQALTQTPIRKALERARSHGPPCIAHWLELPGYSVARLVASLGADCVLVDCEHGNISDTEMYHSVGAIAAAGASPIVRVVGPNAVWMVKRALDCGAHGVMVPCCEGADQIAAIVQAAKYPSARFPGGTRGVGSMWAPTVLGLDDKTYLETANESCVIIAQIESRRGVEKCAEIAAVDGVDMLFVGPNDLASSLGYYAYDHASVPEVQEATARVLATAKEKGKYAGHFAMDANAAAKRVKQGFDFVNLGEDVVELSAWMGAQMDELKELLK